MTQAADPSRRAFLTGACAIVGLSLGAALLADEASAAPGIVRKPNGTVVVTVAAVPALAKVGGAALLGRVKGVPTAVVRTGPDTYEALDLRCTHAGVTVRDTGSSWLCPAHGSQFAIDGALERGPAKRPLATLRSRMNAKGELRVG